MNMGIMKPEPTKKYQHRNYFPLLSFYFRLGWYSALYKLFEFFKFPWPDSINQINDKKVRWNCLKANYVDSIERRGLYYYKCHKGLGLV